MVVSLLIMLTMRGFGHFWPSEVIEIERPAGNTFGERKQREEVPVQRLRDMGMLLPDSVEFVARRLVKTGNRDMTGQDFYWLLEKEIEHAKVPAEVVVLERREWGNFYGRLLSVKESGVVVVTGNTVYAELQKRLARSDELFSQIEEIEKHEIGAVNYSMEKLRLKRRSLELKGTLNAESEEEIRIKTAALQKEYEGYQSALQELYKRIKRDSLVIESADGKPLEQPLRSIVRAYQPNQMSTLGKLAFYFEKLWEFVSDDPREANTEGGIFPAIFGTIMMVFLMSILVTPLGVIAAIYLREYAKQGFLTRTIRIAVNNLAGVPSIVYGIFGLGFFVYFLGGTIDQIFYPEALPAPTFGTPGLMWAALTLAILTMPVVIVSTEEGLSRVPKAIREGSLALGATKAETLWRTVIPMASPSIMTGMILAIARAAGEVAPLMLVGVVKLAPTLPVDGNYPFLHLDRKFMHLGFHIYDVGFQSPNVEAARPLVYATALLLVVVIVVLNLAAISIRNRLREKYKALES
jgi:phosphate transport system permease protein